MFYFVYSVISINNVYKTFSYTVTKIFKKSSYKLCLQQGQIEHHAAITMNKDEQSYNVSCLAFVAVVQLDCKEKYGLIYEVF